MNVDVVAVGSGLWVGPTFDPDPHPPRSPAPELR
jgi:hypothetical protein